ncbi:unnamed protein product [Phytophthora fragariaefolia]|uniref:DNA-directed primase/polymerase protein n=1 Tax=Phytophthora fragariaefolia TaxID=1490495 RepID=A0A9W6U894_9STRA|nr:unnamed protein product [Phytophthora fragariaefolia]
MTQVFQSEACRVWTGALGAPLHAIEDAEQRELDVLPFSVQIWLSSQPVAASGDAQSSREQGLYLVKSPGIEANSTQLQQNPSILLPADALSCFALYRCVLTRLQSSGVALQNDDSGDGSDAFYDTEVAEEFLAALHSAFPKVQLSSSAKDCLARREMSRRKAGANKLGKMVKRRKTLSAEVFYGVEPLKPTLPGSSSGRVCGSSWGSFYEKLQFRVSHSLLCQLEGTAPISSSFPRQHEAFEFADQIATLRKRVKATRGVSENIGYDGDDVPRVFSFESADNGKRRFLVSSFAEFWKNYKSTRADQRHVYEIILEGTPCRLYFDLEFKRAINPDVDGDSLVTRLVSLLQLQFYVRTWYYNSDRSQKLTQYFVQRSDLVVFSDAHTEDPEAHDQYTPFLINTETINDPVNKKQLFIDTGVYTRNRMFRVLGSSKFKKQAILRPLDASLSIPSDMDKELFLSSLVCPYPSREVTEKHRCRLLRCDPSPAALGRNRSFTALRSSTKTLSSSSVECRRSIYPALDTFIRAIATTGGVQGEIRAIQMLMANDSAMLAVLPGQYPHQEQNDDMTKPAQAKCPTSSRTGGLIVHYGKTCTAATIADEIIPTSPVVILSTGKSFMSSHPPRSSSSSPTVNLTWHAAGRINNSDRPPIAPVAHMTLAIVYLVNIAICASASTASAVVSLLFQPNSDCVMATPLRDPGLRRPV